MNALAKTPRVPELFSVDAEQELIGAIISAPGEYWRVSDRIASMDFFDPLHGRIWDAIGTIMERGGSLSPRTLEAILSGDKGLEEIGTDYLQNLKLAVSVAANVRELVDVVSDFAKRRRIVQVADAAIQAAYSERDISPDVIADRAGEELYDGAHSLEIGNGPEPLSVVAARAAALAEQAHRHPEKAKIATGLSTVDAALGGLFPGHLHVLGAPPSVGKSGMIAQMGLAAARADYAGLIFSKEMAAEEIATRYMAAEIGVSANRIDEGRTRAQDIEAIAMAARGYDSVPLFLDGTSALSVAQMRGRAQALRRRHGSLSLIVVDHLRFVRAADGRAPEHERLDQITKDLKALAKDMHIAVLLVATLNREFWKRASHRPMVSDLYGASAIEYNADHIWFLHREEFFLERDEPPAEDQKAHDDWYRKLAAARGFAEVFSVKRRGGPLGSAKLKFDGPFVRFSDIEDTAAQAAQEGLL